ncbi:DNA repair protein RecO [Ideonella sp.]|jgi:DNA repair protein RecO (recombination protein O)|uniref:DNA repair protein RecO n=1 Tax=Ideonella sp. TaxID=1929293 RepID=UPI0037BE733B
MSTARGADASTAKLPRSRAATTAAYVLHRYDWSETSLILDLFTREQGRLTVVAKGAKRPYSQLRPVLLPFQGLLASVSRPSRDENAEISTLRGAEWLGGAPMLSGAALFSGFYLNELLMKLLPRHDPHPVLFDAYAATLPALAQPDEWVSAAALRAFELVLLRETGFLPQLDRLATQGAVQAGKAYGLRPGLGLIPATPDDHPLPGEALLAIQAALTEGDLARVQYACAAQGTVLKLTLRTLLHYHLGTPRLRTRDVMLDAQQLLDAPRLAVPEAPTA